MIKVTSIMDSSKHSLALVVLKNFSLLTLPCSQFLSIHSERYGSQNAGAFYLSAAQKLSLSMPAFCRNFWRGSGKRVGVTEQSTSGILIFEWYIGIYSRAHVI